MDNKTLFDEIERHALVKARAFKRIITEYKSVYDALYYTCVGLSRWQRASVYKKAYKLLKKDIKQINKITKAARKAERAEKVKK
jgi:hypothetical protein